jgi:hypothetical protein
MSGRARDGRPAQKPTRLSLSGKAVAWAVDNIEDEKMTAILVVGEQIAKLLTFVIK